MITFGFDRTKLTRDGTPIADTNSTIVDQGELKIRFFADILKDGLDTTAFNNKIASIYRFPSKFKWKPQLEDIEEKVFENESIKEKTTLLKNIIKTSTVGSNIKISDATNVFWESGFGSAKIMATPDPTKYQTPAAQLDSLSKEDANAYWPTDYGVTFDNKFLEEIGFPAGMSWVYQPGGGGAAGGGEGTVTITYSDGSYLVFNVKKGDTNDNVKDLNIGNKNYLEGNTFKNDKINNTSDKNEIIKYVETKEFADVAQVLVYLDFVLAHLNTESRTSSVMITTDGVVHFLNCYFNLSSIYTGSRRGVETGCCTLYSYLAGPVDLKKKFENMIENYYLRIKSQLTATRFGLLIMGQNPSQFWYYCNRRGITKTNGAYKLKPDQEVNVKAFFTDIIDIIDSRITRLNDLKDQVLGIAATFEGDDSAAFDTEFARWSQAVDTQCKIPQILTKLTNGQYILHPIGERQVPFGDILRSYTHSFITGEMDIATIQQLQHAIKAGHTIEIDNIGLAGGRHRAIRKSNNNLSGGGGPGGDPGREGSYYDYIFLCYVKDTMFPGVSIDNQRVASSSLSSPPPKSIADYSDEFALLYDWTASQIDPNTGHIRLPGFYDWFGYTNRNGDYVSGKTDKAIYSEGKKLQQYVYFADNYDDEVRQLTAEEDSFKNSVWLGWVQATSAEGVSFTPPPGSPNTTIASSQEKAAIYESKGRSKGRSDSNLSDNSSKQKFDFGDSSQGNNLFAGRWWCDNCGGFNSNDNEFCHLDGDCESLKPFTSEGGKRRTMKAKKYLRKNKKTVRNNRKKTRKSKA